MIISAVGARCGKCFLARDRWSAIANTHIVFPNESVIDHRFLWYLINDEHYWVKSGTAQPFVKVGKSVWRQLLFPVTTSKIAALYTAAGSAATRVFDFAPAALAR